jgi:hypothetical protein
VKIHSAFRSLAGGLLATAAAFIVASCGGGGATVGTGPIQGGVPSIQPTGATFYAGVPSTISITGGRRPYTLTSSEPTVLSLPLTLDANSIEVIPTNPGVVDTGLQPGDLPVRTVNISARDSNGNTTTASIKVGQNFLTGYGVSFSSNCPTVSGSTTAPDACANGQTVVTLHSVTNGSLYGNRAVRFQVNKGPFSFVPLLGQTIDSNGILTTTTDHSGTALATLHVNAGVSGQFGVLRVIDAATGVYVDEVFPISAAGPQTTLTAVPNTFTFTGPLQGICGTGSGSFMVFDGTAPYTAFSSDANVQVTPTSTTANPGTFTVTASNSQVCVSGATIVITDAVGSRTTVTVNTAQGTATIPAPSAITVAPSSITLVCGTSGSVSVVGGTGAYFTNSTHPRVTAIVSGNTVTITRLTGDTINYPTGGDISVTDGLSTATVSLTVPAFCP